MEFAARRPLLALATLTTAGAMALAPISVTPDLHALGTAPARISTEAVQLTDAWSDLVANTVGSVVQLGGLVIGIDGNVPLPNPTIFVAPVATQLVLNQLIYAVQLFTGQGAKIPTEIAAHLTNLGNVASGLISALPPAIVKQIQTPFFAAKDAIDSITTSTNLLLGLLEAPAVFLDGVLNSQYGLLGINGPIAIPVIVRNLLTAAIYTPPPTIVLPFKKASAAALRQTASLTVTVKVVAPSGTASSARSKPKAPASSSRKAASAKTTNNSTGQGHTNRK